MNLFVTFYLLISIFSISLFAEFGFSVEVPSDKNSLTEIQKGTIDNYISKEINLLVWNVYKGDKKPWEKDYLILSKDKNLILLQEFIDSKIMLNVVEKSQNSGGFLFAKAYKLPLLSIYTGVATISSATSDHVEFYRAKSYEPKIIQTKKISLVSYYKVKDSTKTLLVINTHALNWAKPADVIEQLEELKNIVVQHIGPVIWAGDFNIWPGEKEKYFFDMISKANLLEVAFEEDNRTRYEKGNLPVDFVLIRDIEIISSLTRKGINGSDHTPLEVKLLIK